MKYHARFKWTAVRRIVIRTRARRNGQHQVGTARFQDQLALCLHRQSLILCTGYFQISGVYWRYLHLQTWGMGYTGVYGTPTHRCICQLVVCLCAYGAYTGGYSGQCASMHTHLCTVCICMCVLLDRPMCRHIGRTYGNG